MVTRDNTGPDILLPGGATLQQSVAAVVCSNVSLYKGMTEFQEGEVSVICRKIILIHGQGPGFCYLQVKRFK